MRSTVLALVLFAGCQVPPRPEVAPEAEIAAAAELADPLEFRAVGPDGGPLDEPDAAGAELGYADAVQRAVRTDPGLQAALARVRMALAEADQARLLPNPVLSLVVRFGDGSPETEAALTQPFVQAFQRPHRAGAADQRLRAAAAEALAAALDVIAEVQERYVAVQKSAALQPLFEERLALVERLLRTARARLDAGEGTRGDVVTLDAQRVDLEVAIGRTRLEARTERLHLARRIGEPSSPASWRVDPWRAPPVESRSESEWIEAALVARPEIQALRWHLAALGEEAQLARRSAREGATLGVEAQSENGGSLGPALAVPLPLFDDGRARSARVEAEELEARHELTLARRRVVEEVRTAYEALAASRTNLLRIREELLPLQRQRRQLAEDAYRAGQTDVTPLFLAEQDLRVGQTQAIEGEAQAALVLVRLQRAVGGPL